MKLACHLAAAVAVLAGPLVPVHAKLPPPTADEVRAQQERRAREEAQLERQKTALERAQNQVAERYRRDAVPRVPGGVSDTNMPQNTRMLPGEAPPQGERKHSAEPHSAPAR
jgi:hypothetical protein